MFELDKLIRDNIKNLTAYSSARLDFKGEASVFLDANENCYGSPLKENFNRYPDPLQAKLKSAIGLLKHSPVENIFIGNGSDEVIDLAYRIFCDPGKDNVIICPPTYGMYSVSGNINDVEIRTVNLTNDFELNVDGILATADQNTKILFLCSPNNPTGNVMIRQDVDLLLKSFPGIVIIDEAYINYSKQRTFIEDLPKYQNLIVMQTLSKAWGLAALRIGLAFASLPIIDLLNKVKPPYNINQASQQLALVALKNIDQVNNWMRETIEQREFVIKELSKFSFVEKVYESDANFLLVKVSDAQQLYNHLSSNKIIVRNRSKEIMCENCLRITIGTAKENLELIKALKKYTNA